MKINIKLIFLLLVLPTYIFAEENNLQAGYYFQASPIGFGLKTDHTTAPEIPLEIGLGYTVNELISLEADGSVLLFWKPNDASSVEFLGRAVYNPVGRRLFSPFISFGLGVGSIEDKVTHTKDNQFLFGGDLGVVWNMAVHHAAVFRLSNIYHKTDYVRGSYNIAQASILYRFTF